MIEVNKNICGILYIVATPIGNLEDITYRAVRILKECDLIAAEDTRKALILLNRYNIKNKQIISHHIRNEHKTLDYIIGELKNGRKIAVISEAGSPCISDPGFLIVREALKNGFEPQVIPGVSSLIFAAIASGLPVEKFSFYGFLSTKKNARKRILEGIGRDEKTAFIFESPNRIKGTLKEIVDVIGEECDVTLVKEATKFHEEIIRGKASEVLYKINKRSLKGEFVLAMSSRNIIHKKVTESEKSLINVKRF